MRDPTLAVYEKADLSEYPLKQRLMIRAADLAFYTLIVLIGSTIRYHVEGEEHRRAAEGDGKPSILALWHEVIFASTYYLRHRGIVVLTSKSFDGEYIARFLTRLGFGAIRGSSSRGGVRGLVEMIRVMKSGLPMAFTVDGPRGPRHVAKSGPIMLAKKTGNSILPFVSRPNRFITINSWDRLQIPMPFSKVVVIFGEPIRIDPAADDRAQTEALDKLQKTLDELTMRAKEWGY